MSSNLLFQQNFFDLSRDQKRFEKESNLLEILHRPVQRIGRMAKTETDILAMFKDSLNLQYESFDFKFNTFKELIEEFKLKRDKDQTEMLEMFGISKDVRAKPQKPKIPQIPQPISEKSNSFEDSIPRESNNSASSVKVENNKAKPKKAKLNVSQISQASEVEHRFEPNIQTIEKGRKRPIKLTQSNVRSDSDMDQREQEKQKRMKRPIERLNFQIESNGPNRYEVTRKRLENTIQNKGKILNHYHRIGEILFHPYSTLQMLLDYNESIDYPLVRLEKQENARNDDSDDE